MSPPPINLFVRYRDKRGSRWRRIQNMVANKGPDRTATLCGLTEMNGPLCHIDKLSRVQCLGAAMATR